jgi:DNA-binding PucR family transcriptional regulator
LLAVDPLAARDRLGAAAGRLRALLAIAVKAGRRGRVRVTEFLPELLLADSPDVADHIVSNVFGPLARADVKDLLKTLRCLAVHRFDTAETAAALPLHRNTLLYRISRIEALTGLSRKDQRDRTLVLLAV